ncbi:hypothetical protein [Bradyrhizobium sp. RDM4]|uniref:hypothetical protein n=1 Tax=Bradyrhizobium sp. RDM4 TaxID=3378765 RepID=UPI0038FBFE74
MTFTHTAISRTAISDNLSASAKVNEAIKVATERHARLPECLARFVSAALLRRFPIGDWITEGAQELERARALMLETGAKLFEGFIKGIEHSDMGQISRRAG